MRTDAERSSTPNASLGRRIAPRSQGAWMKWLLIGTAVLYLTLILFIPALNVFVQAFHDGLGPFFSNLVSPPFLNAVRLTLLIAAIALPINTLFGLCAAWAIARHQFPGRTLLLSIIDIPFAISPVVAGLMIVLLYGRNGWFGPLLQANDIRVIFAVPGMVLATLFVTMPFVAREVIPVLEEAGTERCTMDWFGSSCSQPGSIKPAFSIF